jgi:hypothetical protein
LVFRLSSQVGTEIIQILEELALSVDGLLRPFYNGHMGNGARKYYLNRGMGPENII